MLLGSETSLLWFFPEAMRSGVMGQLQAGSPLRPQAPSKLQALPDDSGSEDLRQIMESLQAVSVSLGENRMLCPC